MMINVGRRNGERLINQKRITRHFDMSSSCKGRSCIRNISTGLVFPQGGNLSFSISSAERTAPIPWQRKTKRLLVDWSSLLVFSPVSLPFFLFKEKLSCHVRLWIRVSPRLDAMWFGNMSYTIYTTRILYWDDTMTGMRGLEQVRATLSFVTPPMAVSPFTMNTFTMFNIYIKSYHAPPDCLSSS